MKNIKKAYRKEFPRGSRKAMRKLKEKMRKKYRKVVGSGEPSSSFQRQLRERGERGCTSKFLMS